MAQITRINADLIREIRSIRVEFCCFVYESGITRSGATGTESASRTKPWSNAQKVRFSRMNHKRIEEEDENEL